MNKNYSIHFFLLILVVFLNLNTSSASEYCQAYYNPYTGYFSNSLYCRSYCCGSCYNRYCCALRSDRLIQKNCREKCLSYRDEFNITYTKQICYNSQVCCGTCDTRYCCSIYQNYLYQTTCTNNVNDSTDNNSSSGKIISIIVALCFILIFATVVTVFCVYGKNKRRKARQNHQYQYSNSNVIPYPVQNQNFAYTQPYPPNGQNQQILYPNNLTYPVNGQMQATLPGQQPPYKQQPPYNP